MEGHQYILDFEYFDNLNYTFEEINQKIYENILNNVIQNIEISNEDGHVIKGKDNFFYHITTSENELNNANKKNNDTNRLSRIDLGECENKLRDHYKLNKNISLLILKYEKVANISSERQLQYEVYESLNKTKLNLSVCSDVQVDIYVPVILSEEKQNLYNELQDLGYDLFDIENVFYQDICTPYKSANGTDVILSDRVEYYYNNDETQCQPNCEFTGYSFDTLDIKCQCNIINTEIKVDNEKTEEKKEGAKSIYSSFYDILKFSNYKVLKCYKLAFKLKIFLSINRGNILTVIYFFIHLLCFIIYLIKGKETIKNDLSNNSISLMYYQIKKEQKEIIKNNNIKDKPILDKNNIKNSENKNENKNNNIKILKKNIVNDSLLLKKNNRKNNKKKGRFYKIQFEYPPKRNFLNNNKIEIYYSKNSLYNKKNNSINSKNHVNEITNKINEIKNDNMFNSPNLQEIKEEKLSNFELNNLDYENALKLDKRKFLEIYWSILRREHLILFTFFSCNDHNILYVKFSRFIFLVCTDMALNVFFFSDETMHKMFLDYGKYNFVQQIPQIIYSTIVSQLIEVFLCYLSLTDKYFYQVKNLKIKLQNRISELVKSIQMKIIFFYLFIGIMFFFYWYIITCFCEVYANTQTAFIKDSLSSFGLGLLYPLALYLIPSALRKLSLKFCAGKLSFIYKLSDIIPFF